jgi:hypothetical protein
VLELIQKALDKIAFAIEPEVAHPMDLTIRLGRGDRAPWWIAPLVAAVLSR